MPRTSSVRTDRLQRLPLTFEKGIRQDLEESVVSLGHAPLIQNWDPVVTGGLRVRPAWNQGGTGGPATPAIALLDYQVAWNRLIALHDNGTLYVVEASSPPAGAFTSPGNIGASGASALASAMGDVRLVFALSNNVLLFAVDDTGTLANSGANAVPRNAQALAYHQNSFWAGGGLDLAGVSRPARLFWTDPGANPLSAWPSNNFLDVGLRGGQPIAALAEFGDGLVIGKPDSLWLLQGTPPDLDLHRLDRGEAVQGRTILSTPYGAVVVGTQAVYLFDGANVRVISYPIASAYRESSPPAHSAAFLRDKLYLSQPGLNRLLVFDFLADAWTTHVFLSSEKLGPLLEHGGLLFGGSMGSGLARAIVYMDPTVYGPDAIAGWTRPYTLRTPEYWVGGPDHAATFRHLELRLRQRGGNAQNPKVSVQTTIRLPDGRTSVSTRTVSPIAQAGVFRTRLDLSGETGYAVQFEVTQTLTDVQAASMDIEEAVLLFRGGAQR